MRQTFNNILKTHKDLKVIDRVFTNEDVFEKELSMGI